MSNDATTPYPVPEPTEFTRGFWDACQEKKLIVHVCNDCGHRFLPGAPNCPECWSAAISLQSVSGQGQIFSFAVYRRTYHPAIPAPYVVALIELVEGPRLVSNVVGCSPEEVEIGMPVEVLFEAEDGFMLPRFRPRSAS